MKNGGGLPLFTWLRSRRVLKGQSKIEDLLAHPFGNQYQPKDVTREVMHRILRDKPMHVVDACKIQDKLQGRYNSRQDLFTKHSIVGMVQADRSEKRWHKFLFTSTYALRNDNGANAVRARDNAISKLGKKTKKELEANDEMRTLFYLTNELKGLLNDTRVW
jgi:hypothetical protein